MALFLRILSCITFFLILFIHNAASVSIAQEGAPPPPTVGAQEAAGSSKRTGTVSNDGAVTTQFSVTGSYRVDALDWNIAGELYGNYVNVLSELEWDDLKIFQITLHNRTVIYDALYFRGALGMGRIVDGDNQDSDYAGNNRTMEFSRSNNSADDGSVMDLSLGFGYRFDIGTDGFGLAPVAGYSFHEQNLTMTDGYQTVSNSLPGISVPDVGPFEEDLDSSYDASWEGPWVGLDVFFERKKPVWLFSEMEVLLTWEYHWADYNADADWNLRDDFAHPKSFEHEASGSGIKFSGDAALRFRDNWWLTLGMNYQNWSTRSGTDRLFFSNGDVAETRLNEVNWTSWALSCGVMARF